MSGQYNLEQRENISKIKIILDNLLNIPISKALLIDADKLIDEMMNSITAIEFI
jgi:hypothetical protein